MFCSTLWTKKTNYSCVVELNLKNCLRKNCWTFHLLRIDMPASVLGPPWKDWRLVYLLIDKQSVVSCQYQQTLTNVNTDDGQYSLVLVKASCWQIINILVSKIVDRFWCVICSLFVINWSINRLINICQTS
jgi:hypothetical protein